MSTEQLKTEITYDGDELVVAYAGEIDLSTCEQARALFDCVDWASITRLTVDLRRVEFLDSSGLHLLLGVRETARSNDVPLALVAGASAVHRVFTLTATESLFTWRNGDGSAVRQESIAAS